MNIQGAVYPAVITIILVILDLLEIRSKDPDYRKLFVMIGMTLISGYITYWVMFTR